MIIASSTVMGVRANSALEPELDLVRELTEYIQSGESEFHTYPYVNICNNGTNFMAPTASGECTNRWMECVMGVETQDWCQRQAIEDCKCKPSSYEISEALAEICEDEYTADLPTRGQCRKCVGNECVEECYDETSESSTKFLALGHLFEKNITRIRDTDGYCVECEGLDWKTTTHSCVKCDDGETCHCPPTFVWSETSTKCVLRLSVSDQGSTQINSEAESESTSDASKQGAVLALSILTTAGLAVLV